MASENFDVVVELQEQIEDDRVVSDAESIVGDLPTSGSLSSAELH